MAFTARLSDRVVVVRITSGEPLPLEPSITLTELMTLIGGGGGGGGGLATKVSMPANTAAAGADGEYAVSATAFAVYVDGTGWIFYDGYQK